MTKDDFIVAPYVLFWGSVVYLMLSWGAIFLAVRHFFAQGIIAFPSMHKIAGYSLLLGNAFISTTGVIIFSWKIVVRGKSITVYRLAKLLKREYLLEDVKSTELISGKGKITPKIKICFKDGSSIIAGAYSSGFRTLWKYFGGNEKDIRPSRQKRITKRGSGLLF